MSNGSRGRKISQFITTTTIPDTARISYIDTGTNFTISKANFLTALGVTGTIVQLGDVSGTPILDVAGTVNRIRNLEDGPGIITTVSPNQGALISHNFLTGTAGQNVLAGAILAQPTIRNLVGISGISVGVSIDGKNLEIGGTTQGLANQVSVTQASQLAGILDSDKEYFIDGVVDMGSQTIEVPAAGLTLSGYNFDVSRLISSATGYTMFTSPVGGSGNLIGKDYAIEATGSGSEVYDLTSATGNDAFEFSRINYNNCSSLGTITGYRQGLEVGTGRFGGQPELTLAGVWAGGYFIDTSIVRALTDGAYTLFKAGVGFTMASRFRSNMNLDLPASASYVDFVQANFLNPSTLQLEDGIVTRNGVFDATDANITPNITMSDLASNWMGNNGMPNTFVGGSIGVTTETATTINTQGVFEDLDATLWTAADLQHFDAPTGNQLRHLGNTPIEYKVIASFSLASTGNDILSLRVMRFDSSAATSFEVLTQTRPVNNLLGGRDVAFFNININTVLDENDYIFLEVTNTSSTDAVTAEVDSYYIVEAR